MTEFGFMGERISAIRLTAAKALLTRMACLRGLAGARRRRLPNGKSLPQSGVGETWMGMTPNETAPAVDAHSTTKRLDAGGVEGPCCRNPGRGRHSATADVRRAVLPVPDALAVRVIELPFHNELTEPEIDRIVACLR